MERPDYSLPGWDNCNGQGIYRGDPPDKPYPVYRRKVGGFRLSAYLERHDGLWASRERHVLHAKYGFKSAEDAMRDAERRLADLLDEAQAELAK